MATQPKRRRRQRGEIETLPSGSLRVRVFAGIDPVSKRRHYLTETVAAGPRAQADAEKARTRLLSQVDERRNPRTRATVNQLLDRYLEVLDVEPTTRGTYLGYMNNHIRPLLGDLALGGLGGEVLDSFFAQLRICRAHCRGRKYVQHRTAGEHRCDARCGPHRCRPLGNSSIHQIHGILNGACKRAVRWGWIGTNPLLQAEPPPLARPDPQPPSAEQAARIVMAAWKVLDWGMFVWLAMTTGARRGELCALTWDRVDFSGGVLAIRSSIAQRGAKTWEKDTKSHQQRRITLDEQTVELLRFYYERCVERASAVGLGLDGASRIFSNSPDGSTWLKPDSVGQRYIRMCARLGWDMNIHQLRHYSATELIAAGVDVRTVAGRMGYGGGGATTLRVYSAWLSEADQRAAGSLAVRMPAPPVSIDRAGELTVAAVADEDASPYQRIAEDLRAAIRCGLLKPGDPLPPVAELAVHYDVAVTTAHRAVAVLTAAGQVEASRGKRARVTRPAGSSVVQTSRVAAG
jgi:integrase